MKVKMPVSAEAHQWFTPSLPGRTRMAKISVMGSSVSYWVYEPVEAPADAPTVLAVHGFRGDHHGLLRIADHLPGMRLVMPDLPGFGKSAAFESEPHTVDSYVEFLHGFMAATGLGADTVLLGHSFGSIIASHFVAADPDAVLKLILINPIAAPALEGPKGLLTRLAVIYYQVSARLPERLGLAVLRSPLIVRLMSITMAKTRDPQLRRFIHGQHHSYFSAFANRDALQESFRASVGSNVREVATRLELPVLLVAGEKDEIAVLKDQHLLLGELPHGTLCVIPDVGHLIHYETPEPAAAAIRTFLEEPPA